MKRDTFLEILTKDRKIAAKLRRRAIFKRIFLSMMIVFAVLMIITLIQTFYWSIFLGREKTDYWGMTVMGIWLVSIFGLVLSDNSNPLLKVDKFNNQFFVLVELLISEIEKRKKLSYHLSELILLFKRYLYKMNSHAMSVYVFESNEITSVTSKISDIPSSKLRSLVDSNKELILNFLNSLNNMYECKINDKPFKEYEHDLLIKYIDKINSYQSTKPIRFSNRYLKVLEFMQKNKKKGLISLIILFGLLGLILKLLGMDDSKYIDYFMYIIAVISIILGVLSLKDKE